MLAETFIISKKQDFFNLVKIKNVIETINEPFFMNILIIITRKRKSCTVITEEIYI